MSVGRKCVTVLGGDRRMIEVVRCFLSAGLQVRTAGLDCRIEHQRLHPCTEAVDALTMSDAVVLPVPGLTDESMLTAESLRRLNPQATLFTGISSDYLNRICTEADLPVVEYREADEFAIWNSIPSAEGAIQMAMEMTPFVLFGSRSLVIGFGRTGKAVALLLHGLRSQVAVAVRSERDLARVWAAGYEPIRMQDLGETVSEADLIFNTAPAMVLPRAILERAQPHTAIIDLASAPGGTDFTAAAQLGLTAKLAPGLPGIVAPVTAGRIIANLILRHLDHPRWEEGDQ